MTHSSACLIGAQLQSKIPRLLNTNDKIIINNDQSLDDVTLVNRLGSGSLVGRRQTNEKRKGRKKNKEE